MCIIGYRRPVTPGAGVIALDALYIVSNLLAFLLYFALAVVLWRVSRSAVVVALAFGVLGMAAYMASPRAVEMLMLARAYGEAEATERVALVATGDGMLATWMGTAFDIYYFFNLVTLLILAPDHRSSIGKGPSHLLTTGAISIPHAAPGPLRRSRLESPAR